MDFGGDSVRFNKKGIHSYLVGVAKVKAGVRENK